MHCWFDCCIQVRHSPAAHSMFGAWKRRRETHKWIKFIAFFNGCQTATTYSIDFECICIHRHCCCCCRCRVSIKRVRVVQNICRCIAKASTEPKSTNENYELLPNFMASGWRRCEYEKCLAQQRIFTGLFTICDSENRTTHNRISLSSVWVRIRKIAQPVDDGQQIWNSFLLLAGRKIPVIQYTKCHSIKFSACVSSVDEQAKVSTNAGCDGNRHKALTKHS